MKSRDLGPVGHFVKSGGGSVRNLPIVKKPIHPENWPNSLPINEVDSAAVVAPENMSAIDRALHAIIDPYSKK